MEQMPEFILTALKIEIGKKFDEEIKNFTQRMNEKKEYVIAGVLLNITKEIQVMHAGTDLIITIKSEKL